MAAIHAGYLLPSKFFPSRRRITGKLKSTAPPPPIFISANPGHVNLNHLKDLYTYCNHSCYRFPDSTGKFSPIEPEKLRIAVSHSSVVVSVFTKSEFVTPEVSNLSGVGGEWVARLAPVTPENGVLIGFGRAVTDGGLTAAIYDVMVHPSVQGRGIGRMIVQRIVRILTSKGVYDIGALCSEKERLFFRACGFGDDMMGATTMAYRRTKF